MSWDSNTSTHYITNALCLCYTGHCLFMLVADYFDFDITRLKLIE